MTTPLKTAQSFDIQSSTVTVWVFKKRQGLAGDQPGYTGRWIETTPTLDTALKTTVSHIQSGITETQKYQLLAQNNEGSALTIPLEETFASIIMDQTTDPIATKMVKNLREINNSNFYVVRFVSKERVFYAVKKTDSSWKARKARNAMSVVFQNHQLTLDENPRFTISRSFDFLIIDETILIINKANFESVLNYKAAHLEDFSELQKENGFSAAFSDLTHLVDYVGLNKIHLRRASAIRLKGHYKDPEFLARLRAEAQGLGFNITFDKDGKIVPTPESCPDIFRALLDHRLDSRLSKKLYDVENAADVRAP